jgi:hypothetical protein
VRGLIRSPLLGPKGNAEFLVHWGYPGGGDAKISTFVDKIFEPQRHKEHEEDHGEP